MKSCVRTGWGRRASLILLAMVMLSGVAEAQTDWQQLLERVMEDVAEEQTSTTWEHLYEELAEQQAHPLNLNTATREELENLPFLNDKQVEELLAYIYEYGPMKDLGELSLVKGMDYDVRLLLSHFVYVGEVGTKTSFSMKDLLKHGRHEAIIRMDLPCYEKAGYKEYSDSILSRYPNRRYLGEPYYHSVRYNFKYLDKLNIGFTAEKDAGESLFANGVNGYDYYAFYLMLSNIGKLKTLIVGDYRLRFGQGLVMNTDFSLGKTAMLSSIGWGKRGIKKHSSTSEYNAFRGVAATYKFWKMEATAFFSHRNQDANLNKQLFITSLKTDGLHRTPLEYSKRGNISNTLFGSNLSLHSGAFHGGLTAVYNTFNTLLKPASQAYKRYYPQGDRFFTMGADYMYNSYLFSFSGETAFSKGGGWGTLNKVQFRLWDDYLFTMLQRYYSRDFWSLYANTFSENSETRNECGFYLGVEAAPWKGWTLSGYADFCYFPWLKYGVSGSSYGGEGMVQGSYAFSDVCKTTLRYRCKVRERDYKSSTGKKYLVTHVHHRLRLSQDYALNSRLQCTTLIDYNCLQVLEELSQGVMLTQRLSWNPLSLPLSLHVGLSYFNTEDYDTRISVYERGLLYAFSFPSYYGHGYRGYATFRWNLCKQLTALIRLSHTRYFDRSTIGSGTELIDASHKEDVGLQIRWKW